MNALTVRPQPTEVMKKVLRFVNWWVVTASFVVFACLEVVCVYYLMAFLGCLPK